MQAAVVAPAGPFSREELRKALQAAATQGLEVHLAPHVRAFYEGQEPPSSWPYLFADDGRRREDFLWALRGEFPLIWCARGGYGSMRLLETLEEADLRRAKGRMLLGFSDITALLSAWHAHGGVAVHGPSFLDLGEEGDWGPLWSFLREGFRGRRYTFPQAVTLSGGKARGPIRGGNLSLLAHLLGTPFFPDLEGAILLIEDVHEPLYRLDRMLTQLRMAGVLKGVAGILWGTTRIPREEDGSSLHRLLLDRLGDLKVPILADLPFSHEMPRWPLPLVEAHLDADRKELTLR
ncbi:MAG: LD-carboxypeptidase [Clostridiales bacterium]|nr:LD-carboxypeptidase [Clostridiales bacterium]